MMPIVLPFKLRLSAIRAQLPPRTCLRSIGLYGSFAAESRSMLFQSVDAMDASRERKHQREGVLRAGDIGSPAHAENLDAGSGVGGGIDVSEHGAVFLNDLEFGCGSKLLCSHGEGLDDQCARGRKIDIRNPFSVAINLLTYMRRKLDQNPFAKLVSPPP